MSLYTIETQWKDYYPKVYGYFFRRIDTKIDVEDLTSLTMESFINVLNDPNKELSNPMHIYGKLLTIS